MPETKIQQKPKKVETERRPSWTMDVMILSNLNEISKFVDENAMQVDSGNLNAIINWRAGLRQFYRNIKSFFPQDAELVASESFKQLDVILNPIDRVTPNDDESYKKAYNILTNLNEMFYHARNELFMKIITMIHPVEKATKYAFSALPEEERQKRIKTAMDKIGDDNPTEDID